jgi:hypothetical protein
MIEYCAAVATSGTTKGAYVFQYDDSTNTVSIAYTWPNVGSFVAACIVKSPDGYYYVYGTYGTTKIRVYKLTSALVVVESWGTTGYCEITTTHGAPYNMSIDVSNHILLTHRATSTANVHYIGTSGTVIWSNRAYYSDGTPGIAECIGCALHASGDALVLIFLTNILQVCRMAAADGAYIDSYEANGTTTNNSKLHYSTSDRIYVLRYAVSSATLYKFTPSDYTTPLYTTSSLVLNSDIQPKEHKRNGQLYAGKRGTTYAFSKIDASNGQDVLASYTYDLSSTIAARSVSELSSGRVMYFTPVSTSADGTFNVWVLDENLVFLAGLSTGDESFTYSSGLGSPIITSNPPDDLLYEKKLVAISGNSVYYESADGVFSEIEDLGGVTGEPAADALDTEKALTACEAYQKVFIANDTTLSVAEFRNYRCSQAGAITTYPARGTLLYQNGADPAVVSVDMIMVSGKTMTVAVISGTLEADTALTTEVAGGGTTIMTPTEVTSPPFIYDWVPYQTAAGVFAGTMPDRATLVCNYRGRLVLSGNRIYPFQWYMSRQADPFDWAYAATDSQTPVAGGNSDAGELGDVVSSMIPCQDDYLIFGCANSIWVMRGDPAAGGSLDEVSRSTGIFGPKSWCFDDSNNLYFWGRGGLYRMAYGFQGIENLTFSVLPNVVEDYAPSKDTHRIVMAFDRVKSQIYCFITNTDSGDNNTLVYDIRTGGFFPEEYPVELAVFCAHFYEAINPDYQKLYLGCRDSFLRYFDDTKKDDAGYDGDVEIISKAVIGPIMMAPDADSRGRLKTLSITTGSDTDTVDYELFSSDTAEEVVDDMAADTSPLHTGTLSGPNRIQKLRPRTRAAWMGLILKNSTISETWSFEKAVADIKAAGNI